MMHGPDPARKLPRRRVLGASALIGVLSWRARAAGLARPAGPVILTVSGNIRERNDASAAQFDRPMLEALGTQVIETHTPWYNGVTRFEGVPMRVLMRAVGAAGDHLTAVALNDYTTDVPFSDIERYGPLLALKRDGAYMPVRDKGPLFLVYPYDADPELRDQIYYSRSAWQIRQLVVQ